MRADEVRAEMERLLRQVPFRPFVVTLENRQRLTVDHPENLGLSTAQDGRSAGFRVPDGAPRLFSTFEAVTSITIEDQAGER